MDSQQNDNKTSTFVSGDGVEMSIVNQPVGLHINHVSVSIKLYSFQKICPEEDFPQSPRNRCVQSNHFFSTKGKYLLFQKKT